MDVPPDCKLSSIRMEADFYGLQNVVEHINYLEKKPEDLSKSIRNVGQQQPFFHLYTVPYLSIETPFYENEGCYVDSADRNAFMFGKDNSVTAILSPEFEGDAYAQAKVQCTILSYPFNFTQSFSFRWSTNTQNVQGSGLEKLEELI